MVSALGQTQFFVNHYFIIIGQVNFLLTSVFDNFLVHRQVQNIAFSHCLPNQRLLFMFQCMMVASYSKLQPATEIPMNQAGIITTSSNSFVEF